MKVTINFYRGGSHLETIEGEEIYEINGDDLKVFLAEIMNKMPIFLDESIEVKPIHIPYYYNAHYFVLGDRIELIIDLARCTEY